MGLLGSLQAIRLGMSQHFSKIVVPRPATLANTVLLCSALVAAVNVQASAGGRIGFSGDPSANGGAPCSVCHAPDGATPPTIIIVGPATISAGVTQNYSVVMTGGPAQTAGIGISAENDVGNLLPSSGDLQQLNGELTHTGPKNFSANMATFNFRFTAPNYNTQVTLYAAGNSTNGALDLRGDGVATTSLDITVNNGFEPPPEPPKPAVGELSATLFAAGFNQPVAIENAGDGRLFVVERPGVIRIIQSNGAVVSTPFLDIATRVDSGASEMGLLGLAFNPNYASNGYFYVYYTRDPGPGLDRSRVSRFKVTGNPDIADANSELVLLEFEQPYSNHNGGDLHFDSFGYLNIASGDGGSGGDPQNRGQSTTTLLGKMLRINVDPPPPGCGLPPAKGPDCNISGAANYSIPSDNAFNDGAGGAGCDEIFALGARNPWRFTFDRATGAMWIADVGQNIYEEVNYLPPGSSGGINLGWRCFEGTEPYNISNCNRVYLPPVHTYSHATSGCSVTGGRVYRGALSPHLQGQYFFTDFCESSIRALSGQPGNLSHRIVLPSGQLSAVSTFGEDYLGELYVAELNSGSIYRLDAVPPPGC
jgi:glucose/arabinose dehydrogenase